MTPTPGQLVHYPDEKHGFERVGHLVSMGRKYAKVLPVLGKSVKIAVGDIRPVTKEK